MPNQDIRVGFTFRNNLILTKMEERGITSVAELCRQLNEQSKRATKINQANIGRLINMKESAQNQEGSWTYYALRLAEFFNCLPEDLFSNMQKQIALKRNRAEAELNFAEIQALLIQPQANPEAQLQAKELSGRIREALASLPTRQGEVLRMRFGIDCEEMTLEQISEIYSVNRERIRQIELRGLRNLKHPSKSKVILATAATSSKVKSPWGIETVHNFDESVLDALREKQ